MTHSKSGSLLVILLWILAILSVIGVSLGYRVALDIKLTKASTAETKASYISRAAVAQAITVLKKDKTLSHDTLNDVWANNPGEFEEKMLGLYSFSIFHQEGEKKTYGLIDAERAINLNTAPQEVLNNLFEILDIDTDLTATLLDWIDEDDDDRNHGRGAETEHYENLRKPYKAKNGPLENINELLLIKGFTPEIVAKLNPHVTLYGTGQINLNTASPITFEAIGLSPSFAEKVARFRLGDDGIWNTEDDGIVLSFDEFVTSLDRFEGLEGNEKNTLSKFKNFFRVTSTAFYVQAHIISSLHVEKDLKAVLLIEKGKDVEVIYWHEN